MGKSIKHVNKVVMRHISKFICPAVCVCWLLAGCASETKNESATAKEALNKEKAGEANKAASAEGKGGQPAAATPQAATAASGTTAAAPPPPEAQEAPEKPAPIPAAEVDSALMLVRKGQYEQAINQAKSALQKNEKYVPAMVVMARAYYQLNKLEFADSICDIALSIDPSAGDCLNIKGFVALKAENDPLAREQFEKATKAKSSFGPAWLNLGAQYLKVKNYTAAIGALEKAVSLMPNRPEAHLNLGSAYRGAGEVGKAQQSLNQAIKLRPSYASAYFNLGILYLDAASFPGLNKLQQLNMAVENFNNYKRQMTYLSKDDPVDSYIKEAQKAYEREQKQLLRDAQRKAREAAKKSAPPAPATPKAEATKQTKPGTTGTTANPQTPQTVEGAKAKTPAKMQIELKAKDEKGEGAKKVEPVKK